jgi:hypothetical protein
LDLHYIADVQVVDPFVLVQEAQNTAHVRIIGNIDLFKVNLTDMLFLLGLGRQGLINHPLKHLFDDWEELKGSSF